ncbi:3-deoxy-7-phosphoheptulonate synthase [Streptomyces sp. WZ.A104]|uniref:3-deoxy-7-phosphoheptulonate synthase n=1 Tax=Streptomyces sp. WZ.A104 TaxID=2023771 RepID=UPI000BBC58EB|nr:3-deoxy-7-phosphoheptulonate synthase [Streptomyces sp. WZ.A104]PCG85255.1 3-deoxy-7-phosphoheptulonate synthase [Streptomyces sp. WZ.A104]
MSSLPHSTALPALQQPPWADQEAVDEVEQHIAELPPLTAPDEISMLRMRLGAVARGSALLLQGGDCVERFEDSGSGAVRRKVRQLQDLSTLMRDRTGLPVVAVGRMAGQYAKPRTEPWEQAPHGERVQSFRGDAVNSFVADRRLRTPDPWRMLTAYNCARLVLDTLRETWREGPHDRAVFASHELLLLPYERALRRGGRSTPLLTSTHFGWVGERTREPGGAHVELVRSAGNPVGVKLGPEATPWDVLDLLTLLNPDGIPGRLTFITRMGAGRISEALPPIVRTVRETGIPVVWLCDPMHGNTFNTAGGTKTRSVPVILQEIKKFTEVVSENGGWPGGLHLEMTPDPVTECTHLLPGQDTPEFPDYRSACDPRLNARQAVMAVEMFLAARSTSRKE